MSMVDRYAWADQDPEYQRRERERLNKYGSYGLFKRMGVGLGLVTRWDRLSSGEQARELK